MQRIATDIIALHDADPILKRRYGESPTTDHEPITLVTRRPSGELSTICRENDGHQHPRAPVIVGDGDPADNAVAKQQKDRSITSGGLPGTNAT